MQVHIYIEVGFFCGGQVLAFDGYQTVLRIGEDTAVGVVSSLVDHIIGEFGCIEAHVAVDHTHILAFVGIEVGNFAQSVVVELIGVYEQGVTLLHTHVAEGVHTFGCGVVMGAVTVHLHGALGEVYRARKNHE